jgi:hypothetical protein
MAKHFARINPWVWLRHWRLRYTEREIQTLDGLHGWRRPLLPLTKEINDRNTHGIKSVNISVKGGSDMAGCVDALRQKRAKRRRSIAPPKYVGVREIHGVLEIQERKFVS